MGNTNTCFNKVKKSSRDFDWEVYYYGGAENKIATEIRKTLASQQMQGHNYSSYD
jgi:hypothetical protein